MKHLKEFSLNENVEETPSIIETIDLQTIKNYIIGELIEDEEFTDSFLEKSEVEDLIEEASSKIMYGYQWELDHIGEKESYLELKDALLNLL